MRYSSLVIPGFAVAGVILILSADIAGAATCPPVHVSEIQSPLGCVDTVVTKSNPPVGPSMADGGSMQFRDGIMPGHGKNDRMNYLYVAPGDHPVADVGDRVRVCLLTIPKKGNGCDPSQDSRGREFLVYDRTRGGESDNAAVYTNAEHFCGGA